MSYRANEGYVIGFSVFSWVIQQCQGKGKKSKREISDLQVCLGSLTDLERTVDR